MAAELKLTKTPKADEMILIAGWRQWADAGSVSSAFPKYLVKQTKAEKIGEISTDGFYMFQIPGTHDLVRPVIKLEDGYPFELEVRKNELYYTQLGDKGVLIFIGDEPHLDVDRYGNAFFEIVRQLNVKRVVVLGGVYGELPFDRERTIGGSYSMKPLKTEMEKFAVRLSGYHGGASIGTYLCKLAESAEIELIAFYAFVPNYELNEMSEDAQSIRIENDFMAWRGIMSRIVHMFGLEFDMSDLDTQCKRLIAVIENKVDEIDKRLPDLGIRAYMTRLSEEFEETPFYPLDDVWEEELRNLFDDTDE